MRQNGAFLGFYIMRRVVNMAPLGWDDEKSQWTWPRTHPDFVAIKGRTSILEPRRGNPPQADSLAA
jgi:hypothetical protein